MGVPHRILLKYLRNSTIKIYKPRLIDQKKMRENVFLGCSAKSVARQYLHNNTEVKNRSWQLQVANVGAMALHYCPGSPSSLGMPCFHGKSMDTRCIFLYYFSSIGVSLNRTFIFGSQSWLHSLSSGPWVCFTYSPYVGLHEILFPATPHPRRFLKILLPLSNGKYIEIGD